MKSYHFLTFLAILLFENLELFGQQVLWKKILNKESFGESISMTKSGNFLLGGSSIFNYKSLIASFDKNGNKLWEWNLCDTCKGAPYVIYSKELEDGRILIITTGSNLFIIDSLALQIDTLINLSASTGYDEQINKVLDFKNELIITGSYNDGNKKYGLIKTRFSTTNVKIIDQVIQIQSGGIYQMAIMKDSSLIECQLNSSSYTVRKINFLNDTLWRKNISNYNFNIRDILVAKDQRLIILGTKRETKSNKDITSTIIYALNSNGDSLWQKIYNPSQLNANTFSAYYISNRIKETKEGDFIVVGTDGIFGPVSDLSVTKVNSDGELIWNHLESISSPRGSEGADFLFDYDQNIIVAGNAGVTDVHSDLRAFILKMTNPLVYTNNPDLGFTIIYPNPCNEELTIENQKNQIIDKIELYNIDGRFISQFKINNTVFNLNTSNLNSGIYLFKLYTGQNQIVKKFCKI